MTSIKPYTLRKGDTGQTVEQLQQALRVRADGFFGPKTDKALRNYQTEDIGLSSDGIAGPLTLGSLGLCVEAGIDVSHWQGIVDWGKVKRAGVAFAYIKATEGSTHEDRRFQSNIKHARSEGLVAGAYHFSRPDTNADIDQPCKDARQEAERFLRSYRPQRGDLKPILDLERGLGPDDNYNARWCLEWLSYVEREVATPMVYAARWVVNKYLKNADDDLLSELSSYPAVWASYNKGSSPERFPEKVWTDWVVWQYTGRGSCDGIKGRVDLNWSAGGALDRMVID